jgi:hypothetical protein
MTKKEIVLLYRLPEISKQQFRDYYEDHHVHLIIRLLPTISRYVRNYTQEATTQVPWDSFTEVWFEGDAAYADYLRRISDPQIIGEIRRDELNFIDSKRSQRVPVEEQVTPDDFFRRIRGN